ncbi:MAG: hypothetical protein IJQ52_05165 [Bacteroidales bacterium]|nr:hypothetical protein [Bacteroidales bacterium]
MPHFPFTTSGDNALGQNWNVVYDYWIVDQLGVNLGGKLGNYTDIWFPFASLYYYDGNLYRTRQVYIWSKTYTPLQEDGVPIFELEAGGYCMIWKSVLL